jgi:hypothetical protein
MSVSRRLVLAGGAASALVPSVGLAQDEDVKGAFWKLITGNRIAFDEGMALVATLDGPEFVPALIVAQRFSKFPNKWFDPEMQRLSGEKIEGWFDWMLWQETNPDIRPPEWFEAFKREVFIAVDANFELFLRPEYLKRNKTKIRFEEVAWGGVRKDGIPSLDNPEMITAGDAGYLKEDDLVFGVSINGDTRAYPLRIMGWHEMFNDVIGGVPVALAYCTLCGSGILFETEAGRSAPLVFGSSGFLYRSNKLMFDRETHTLWNQFTGEPVIGPLADSGLVLKQRPVVITPWAEWKAQNPQTKVLSLVTGHDRDYGSGVVYRDYFASDALMFPTRVDETVLAQKDYVFGVRQFGAAKAWPLAAFKDRRLINDRIGDRDLVLIGDEAGRNVRAFLREGQEFTRTEGILTSADGAVWQVTEDALISGDHSLERVAGHVAYWFAWSGYMGEVAELYAP